MATGGAGGTATGGMVGTTGGTAGMAGISGSGGQVSMECGDGIRDPLLEECDDGNTNDFGDSCNNSCEVLDAVVTNAPSGPTSSGDRTLGNGRHPASSVNNGFAVAYVETEGPDVRVGLTRFDAVGVPQSRIDFGVPTTPVLFADPVLAGLPNGTYAAAFTDFDSGTPMTPNGDGDALGIALRIVNPLLDLPGPLLHANVDPAGPDHFSFSQFDPDIIWTGSELVVAWTDGADSFNGPDLRYREFDQLLNASTGVLDLATTAASEGKVALAPFIGSWAAAWRSATAGMETIEADGPNDSWSVGGHLPPPADDRPALAEVDSSTLLVVYTEGTDPGMTGVANTPRLRAALLEAGGSTSMVLPIDPLDPDYFGDESLAQSHPNIVRAGDRLFVTWRSERRLGDARGEELWVKEVTCSADPCGELDLDLSIQEIPLPRQDTHVFQDQRAPALAPFAGSQPALVTAWEDYGQSFGPGQGTPDVLVEFIPLPLLRLMGGS